MNNVLSKGVVSLIVLLIFAFAVSEIPVFEWKTAYNRRGSERTNEVMNVGEIESEGKPPAPNGVHDVPTYESRIGESGLLLEDANLQVWLPSRYEEHGRLLFEYFKAGYVNMSLIVGNHDMPVKFSIEHYPEDSPYFWGGTDGRGTIRYDYTNLVDNSPEWINYGVPHVRGYYEEMAHCFMHDLGVKGEVSVGFYETLGWMIGSETALRAASNPYVQAFIANSYQTFNTTTTYYLEHNDGPPGVPKNIWLTRVLAHIFKAEVVDPYGWSTLSKVFEVLQHDYPLRKYDRDHTWGGFLHYLGKVTDRDFHAVFANYGLPIMAWDNVKANGDTRYIFEVKCFDREGTQPTQVQLHLYYNDSVSNTRYPMSFVGGNSETGWTYELEVETEVAPFECAFSANDGAHDIFQAIGEPTVRHAIMPSSITANVDIDPDTLNLRSKGRWVTAYIQLPEEYSVIDIDVSGIRLNDAISVDPEAPTGVQDHDGDGVPDLKVKFDRAEMIASLITGVATLKITGNVDGTPFEGCDTIRVLNR